jgi:L-ascorbate metabolism protein UlaG (beta-lactamase superfamily)
MLTFIILLAGIPLGIHFYQRINPQFGGRLTKDEAERLAQSPNWINGSFQNLQATSMNIGLKDVPGLLQKQFKGRKARAPETTIPIIPFDQDAFLENQNKPKFIWYGHSVLLLRMNNMNILIDPMFGPDASPIGPITTKRFSKNSLEVIDQLPEIDLLLQTHDHYDHLDYASIKKLKNKVKQYWTGLGIGRHFAKWGIAKEQIREFDWWDDAEFEGLNIAYTPSRHFSGRGTNDRAKSLWGGWVITSAQNRIFWSGDGGYGEHFKEIGERLGPFDIGFMECGQYNELWHEIHMYPEEAVWAAQDAGCRMALPVHWGGFTLALHHWQDPIERFIAEAREKNLAILTPEIGEISILDSQQETESWWENY